MGHKSTATAEKSQERKNKWVREMRDRLMRGGCGGKVGVHERFARYIIYYFNVINHVRDNTLGIRGPGWIEVWLLHCLAW